MLEPTVLEPTTKKNQNHQSGLQVTGEGLCLFEKDKRYSNLKKKYTIAPFF